MRARAVLVALSLLFPHLLRAQPRPSSTNAGLRFSASLSPDRGQLTIRWENVSSGPFLLNIGALIGSFGFAPAVQLSLLVPGGPSSTLINRAVPSVIGGRAEALVICLPPGTSYLVNLATHSLMLPETYKPLTQLHGKWSILASYAGLVPYQIAPGGQRVYYDASREHPTPYPFWIGEISATSDTGASITH